MYLILSNFIDFGFSRKNQICENFYPFANTYSPVKAIDLRSIPQTTFDLAIAIFRYLIVIVRHRKKTYQIAFLSTDMTWFDENSLSILLLTSDGRCRSFCNQPQFRQHTLYYSLYFQRIQICI